MHCILSIIIFITLAIVLWTIILNIDGVLSSACLSIPGIIAIASGFIFLVLSFMNVENVNILFILLAIIHFVLLGIFMTISIRARIFAKRWETRKCKCGAYAKYDIPRKPVMFRILRQAKRRGMETIRFDFKCEYCGADDFLEITGDEIKSGDYVEKMACHLRGLESREMNGN